MAAALMTPTVALAGAPTSPSNPYGPTSASNPYGPTSTPATTPETTPDTTTPETTPDTTTPETTPDTTTPETTPDTTTPETTPDTTTPETTPDTTTPETTTPETTTPETTTPETTPETTTPETTPETTTPETTTPETTTPETTTPETTTPAELAVFDPGPCAGAFVTASGSGFNPGETIDISRDGVVVTTATAGADGTFSVRVDIAGVQNGEHVITATGTTSGFTSSGRFDVEPQVCTTTTESSTTAIVVVVTTGTAAAVSNNGSLAITGFPVAPVLGAAILALLAGTALLVATRNRRSLRPSGSEGPSHL